MWNRVLYMCSSVTYEGVYFDLKYKRHSIRIRFLQGNQRSVYGVVAPLPHDSLLAAGKLSCGVFVWNAKGLTLSNLRFHAPARASVTIFGTNYFFSFIHFKRYLVNASTLSFFVSSSYSIIKSGDSLINFLIFFSDTKITS